MTLRTYFFLTLRYMNPRFKRHLYQRDWKTLEYWKKGLRLALPFPILLIITAMIMLFLLHVLDVALEKNKLLSTAFILVSSIVISYFSAKKFMPAPANQYDRKTLHVQLVVIIITSACILLKDAMTTGI